MTLDYYRIFYYVARYKSFSNAAEMLGSNQPNITRCMNILENELDCKLLIRSHKGIQLTTEGEHLFRHVAIAIEQLTYGEKEIIKNKSLESGQINIGISETAMRLYLLDKLQEFHKDYPHVRLKISNHSTPQAIDALEKGLVDIAMVTSPLEIRKPLRKTALRSYHDILIGGSAYKTTASRKRSLKELADFSFVPFLPAPEPMICMSGFSTKTTFGFLRIWKLLPQTRFFRWSAVILASDSVRKALQDRPLSAKRFSRSNSKKKFRSARSPLWKTAENRRALPYRNC